MKKITIEIFIVILFTSLLFNGFIFLIDSDEHFISESIYTPIIDLSDHLNPITCYNYNMDLKSPQNDLSFRNFQYIKQNQDTTEDEWERLKEEELRKLKEEELSKQKELDFDILQKDSTLVHDPTFLNDSLAIDSTARIKHFTFKRNDLPVVQLFEKRKSPFYLKIPDGLVQRSVKLDSTGNYVIIRETIDGKDWRTRIKIPIEKYIELRYAYLNRKNFEELAYKYEVILGKRELADIFEQITNIDIPIPSNPVFSIFGPPKINLRISGAVTIDGSWRNERTEGVTASLLGNVRNEPNFKQDVQININGTIGDKLNIMADWNTQNTFEYENQLKIKYTGYTDEIVQSVEAGNVSLQTSPLVGGGEALFGVKARMQLGPLMLTALASQKKGEVREKILSGGAEAQSFTIHAYQYSTNHYFVDTIYADTSANLNIFNKWYGNPTPIPVEYYRIKDIEVWKTITGLPNPKERKVNAYIYLPSRSRNEKYDESLRGNIDAVPGQIEVGRFVKLESSDYIIHYETGYITFRTQILETDAIAVAYRMEGAPGSENDIFYGEFVTDVPDTVTLVLKLIKPANLQPQYKTAWKLQLRNIYPLGLRNIKKEGFELNIVYREPGQEARDDLNGVKLLNAFGLDKVDDSDNPRPDGKFDFRLGITINTETGEIIFPVLQPFGRNRPSIIPDSLAFYDVYDTLKAIAQLNTAKDRFLIVGKSSGTASSVFNLGFNIVEGSVRVRLGGRELIANVDYIVDYNTGQLIIRNEQALLPNADLRISYEENTLFQLAAKSLFGLRGELDLGPRSFLGFSMLTLNQQTLTDKVRVGEEPIENTIFGIDTRTSFELPFLTNLVNKIVSTRDMSVLSLSGEAAYINPDPNTKKSPIASDRGKSVAYIDDFEGSKQIMSIGVHYTSWKYASPPRGYPWLINPLDTAIMKYKARTFWFNRLPSDVLVTQIWPEKTVARGNEQVTVLDIAYSPLSRGEFNYYPELNIPNRNWGGLMKILSSTASNFLEQNIEFIEFWFLPVKVPQNAKLFLDLGRITEDIIPNKKLDTEDRNFNDLIDQGEDVGLDGIADDIERQLYPNLGSDPSGDNFKFNLGSGDYTGINGTEGNASLTEAGRFPDTEDLNRNGVLDLVNSYFQYEIPLDTNRATNPYIVGGGVRTRWYQLRIPLNDFKLKIGDPSFTNIEMIRLWMTGLDDSMYIRIAEFNLVGNQWRKAIKDDERLSLSVVNIEDNSPYYYSPPDVGRELDRTQQTTGTEKIYKNEQSLLMRVHNLRKGDATFAIKVLFRPMDVFNYQEMKLYYHGKDELKNGDIIVRFGVDSNNYYEYREPIRKDWNNISIKFSEITAIKQKRDSITQIVKIPIEDGPAGAFYGIKGNPSLTQVQMFMVGVAYERTSDAGDSLGFLNGDLWINELRLIGADDREGWAYTGSASLNFGDLIRLNFNYRKQNPFFHAIEQRFGSRVLRTSWGFSGSIDFAKFLPLSMRGSALTLNYSRNESIDQPLYLPNTDILVNEAVEQNYNRLLEKGYDTETAKRISEGLRTSSESYSITENWSVSSFKLFVPSNFFFVKYFWNNLGFGFNYSRTFSRNPQIESQRSWLWNFTTQYSLMFSPANYIKIVDVPVIGTLFEIIPDLKNYRIFYSPTNIGMNLNVNRNRNTSATRTDPLRPLFQRDFRLTRGLQFGWRFSDGGYLNPVFNYSIDFGSTYAHLETKLDTIKSTAGRDSIIEIQRSDREIFKDIFGKNLFGRDYAFNQRVELRFQPVFPSLFKLNNFITLQAGYSVDYRWQNNFQQVELGRSASWGNSINLGLNVRWRQIFEPLFKDDLTPQRSQPDPRSRGRSRQIIDDDEQIPYPGMVQNQPKPAQDTAQSTNQASKAKMVFEFFKRSIKWTLLDYDNISINFNQRNSSMNNGLYGNNSGITNFWNFFIPNKAENGPPRLYQIGFSSNPGRRAPNGNLSDQISQTNGIDLRTSRQLFTGVRLDLSWKVNWNYNRQTAIQTDSLGNVRVTNIAASGSTDRSFLTMPPFLIFSFFGNGIKKVNELYNPNAPNPKENLANAFIEGFETLPILGKLPFFKKFSRYIPRPNWSINWDGLEKFPLFSSFAQRVSLQHTYNSSFARTWRINADGVEETQNQKITYGFQPLIGMNITFKSFGGGNLGANIRIGTNVSYDMGVASRNITETFSRDINISANYTKSGFEVPFLGISLRNDLNISISFTQMRNSSVVYDMLNFKEEGTPQDGTIRTTFEPRIRYVLSSRLTIAIYFRRTKIEPEGASKIPPTTTNEAGLNIHLTI